MEKFPTTRKPMNGYSRDFSVGKKCGKCFLRNDFPEEPRWQPGIFATEDNLDFKKKCGRVVFDKLMKRTVHHTGSAREKCRGWKHFENGLMEYHLGEILNRIRPTPL